MIILTFLFTVFLVKYDLDQAKFMLKTNFAIYYFDKFHQDGQDITLTSEHCKGFINLDQVNKKCMLWTYQHMAIIIKYKPG